MILGLFRSFLFCDWFRAVERNFHKYVACSHSLGSLKESRDTFVFFAFLVNFKTIFLRTLVISMLTMTQAQLMKSTTSSSYIPEPLCDIHQTSRGYPTPGDLLPSPPKSADMLYANEEEIQRWYRQGYTACERYRIKNQIKITENSKIHPPYYINMNHYTSVGQTQCRGRATLYDLTGLIVWPFGPYENGCQTYSKCWFGLLTCGEFKKENVISVLTPELTHELKTISPNMTLPLVDPDSLKFSMKSLIIHLRLLGTEIVVPQQFLHTMTIKHSDKNRQHPQQQQQQQSLQQQQHAGVDVDVDVIIAQYHLTYPSDEYLLEARLFEFYPSALLLPWKTVKTEKEEKKDWMKWGYQNMASIFLGGTESRCKPWTKCSLSNNCCGCDEKSFILHTPAKVIVKDGRNRCINELTKTPTLPLCKIDKHGTSPLGRWIQSSHPSLTPHCTQNISYNLYQMTTHSSLLLLGLGEMKKKKPTAVAVAVTSHNNQSLLSSSLLDLPLLSTDSASWYEASGNPCIHNAEKPEELGISHWFFAPYQCKYHFYSRKQLHQCLKATNISHIHFQGDSMSRDLFSLVSIYLNVSQVTEENMKQMTNHLKMKDIKFNTGSVLLSEGYSWEFDLEVLQISEQPPLPNVIVNNYAFAHRVHHLPKAIPIVENTEYRYWTQQRNQQLLPKPKYLFFQNARDSHGRRGPSFVGNMMRQFSHYLQEMYGSLGFKELDEYQLTVGRFDVSYNPHSDGWHFRGTTKQMEAIILFNMICNDWLAR